MKGNKKRQRLKDMRVVLVNGQRHVVITRVRYATVNDANYCGTGMALCGILKHRETLADFKKRFRQS